MPGRPYRRALETAVREYERLVAEREQLETRIAQLRQTIGALAALCEKAPPLDLGLTDACRSVLRAAYGGLTPAAVKERLDAIGLDLTKYASPLASIHTVLKRLVDAGEARRVTREGKAVYIWNRPHLPVAVTGVGDHPIATQFLWPPVKPGKKARS